MLSKAYAMSVIGIDALKVTVEANVVPGNKYYIIGSPDNAVKESLQRIDSAVKNNSLKLPRQKILVNLSPANIRKEGSGFDLPITCAILAASNQLKDELLDKYVIMGELSLDGNILPVKGALSMAISAKEHGFKGILLPTPNAQEAAAVSSLEVFGFENLRDIIEFLNNISSVKKQRFSAKRNIPRDGPFLHSDFSDVKGQENVKRAFEVAAAGGHHIIMIGPPGAGKTMLARGLPSILPALTFAESLETTRIHSVAGLLSPDSGLAVDRPFRSPHHTLSEVALAGGGQRSRPGEISLAHNGVLFLDELPEFKRATLEVLRQPIEEKRVIINRATMCVEYPANFMLVAAMNPCPCGYYNHSEKECTCSPDSLRRYFNKISGPLLDRIDIQIEVSPVKTTDLILPTGNSEKSATVQARVIAARSIQEGRYHGLGIRTNGQMGAGMTRSVCRLKTPMAQLLQLSVSKLALSARAHDKILKIARTIADLEGSQDIHAHHLSEAIQYRAVERFYSRNG